MGSKGKPEQKPYTGGITRIGGRDVATNTMEGNNVVTAYNPTAQEQQAYNYVQSQLTPIYQRALSNQDFTSYANDVSNDQLDKADTSYRRQLNTAKGALVSSGQSSSSQGLDSLTPFNEAYQSQLATINANTPVLAQQLRANDQSYNTANLANAMNMINQYYNTGNTFMPTAAAASESGNDYNQQVYQNQLAANQLAQQNMLGYAKLGTTLAGTAIQTAPKLAPILASDKNVKKNIVKIGEKNGINIYEFEYKTDKYPELPKGKQIGVIAQEVEHIPNAVVQGDKYKLVDYAVILPLIA
jgi:hypothetical protein